MFGIHSASQKQVWCIFIWKEKRTHTPAYWMSTELNWYIICTADRLQGIFWFDVTFNQPVPWLLFILAIFHSIDMWNFLLWPFLLMQFFIDLELDTLWWWRLVETPYLDKTKSKVSSVLLFIIIPNPQWPPCNFEWRIGSNFHCDLKYSLEGVIFDHNMFS